MDSLFYRPPDKDAEIINVYALASRSKEDAQRAVDRAKNAFVAAEARLNDAQLKYDTDSWDDQKVVAAAEENYEAALTALEIAEAKMRWETNKEYQRPVPKSFVQRTKELLSKIDWKRIRSATYKP